jgi:hypothetical protein
MSSGNKQKNLSKTACIHERVNRERGRWGATGDIICTDCGGLFASRAELDHEREKAKTPIQKKSTNRK